MSFVPRTALALAVLASCAAAAFAQPAAEPFAGKTVTLIIGFGPGGGYDLWARTVARHIGKHLPGKPSVVPQNMPGAGSFIAASHLYNAAPKDGTAFAIIARDAALGPLSGAPGARFDATKFSWLGSPTKEHNVCIAFHTAPVKTAAELRDKQLILGDTGPGTGTRSYPKVLSDLLGYKFKLVSGFRSSADVFLAMERGEVDGICESLDSVNQRKPDWIANKTVNVLLQAGDRPHPDLKDVPFVLDLARNAEERAVLDYLYAGQGIGRPFVAPAGPATRAAEDAARGVRRNDEGSRVHRGCAALKARSRAGRRRPSRGADRPHLRHAEVDHRARRQPDQMTVSSSSVIPRRRLPPHRGPAGALVSRSSTLGGRSSERSSAASTRRLAKSNAADWRSRGRGRSISISSNSRPGPRPHHDDAVGQHDRLVDVVGDDDQRRLECRPTGRADDPAGRRG